MLVKQKNPSHFKEAVLNVVRKIPHGQVLSYKTVAERAGYPKAYRAVASLMSGNYDLTVPCHRVIRSSGEVGEYNRGGTKQKLKLLLAEGWCPENSN